MAVRGLRKKEFANQIPTNNQQHTAYNTGITLVALVITVIILLILAGVAVSMITGESGIFNKTSEAKTKAIIGMMI